MGKGLYTNDYKILCNILGPKFDPSNGANILVFNGVVLLVIGDVTVDSETPVATSSILKICRLKCS